VYNSLAVMAFLLRSVPSDSGWATRTAAHLGAFPENDCIDVTSTGTAPRWLAEDLWRAAR
jgi:hypothetical protein